MPTVVLLRHARSTANASGVLAGRTPGIGLDEHGVAQAAGLVERLAAVPLALVVTSPLQRCVETITPLVTARGITPVPDERLAEVDYGSWTNEPLRTLYKRPLWKVVQQHPSAAVFPDGEGLAAVQARTVAAVRDWDARVAAEHGPDAVWLACTHGDVVKGVVADALGMHLDQFQRLMADPCSVSVVRYTETRPFVWRTNDSGGDLSVLAPARRRRRRVMPAASDAVVGGSPGP
ncbi:MAG TPA: histidine phosphatase family protein [Pseudonocardiaceae bacterium]